jgi:cell division transport system ATP-binding protein
LLIQITGLTKRLDGRTVLDGISLGVPRGETLAITGPSGAGKTTLLRCLNGLERPDAGTVRVGDTTWSAGQAGTEGHLQDLRRRVGFVFQDHKLLFDRNAFENVALPLRVAGFARDETGRRVRAALDKVGLLAREKAMPVALSGGEQQRLCIARAIVNRPSILIADEPTGNLDPEYAAAIVDLFTSFNQVGVTVMMSTHDEASLARLNCRRIALDHGVVAAP